MDPIGYMTDGHFVYRPLGKKRRKEIPADLPVQLAHAIHRAAAANGKIGHVETLRRIARILATQGQQTGEIDGEFVLGIVAEVLLDQTRRETIESGGHSRVGGEQVPYARDG